MPATEIKAAPPRYDTEARALYVSVGANVDHRVAQTRPADGIVFDCNRDGFVVGIEVLINARKRLQRASVRSLEGVGEGFYNLKLDADPDVENVQAYDVNQRAIQVGTPDEATAIFQIAKYVFVARSQTATLTVWITGLLLPSDESR
jgi:uncharacterized protein YuzE